MNVKPIIYELKDNKEELNYFKNEVLSQKSEKEKRIIMNFPTVYIHNWKTKKKYEVYIGETNDIFRRTLEHYDKAGSDDSWQKLAKINDADLFIIGHELFNKSLTLDVENKLIQYMSCVEEVEEVHNARGNPQKEYYLSDEFEEIFNNIWLSLRRKNKELFPAASVICDSAIYKASPLHKLTKEQEIAQERIINLVTKALRNNKEKQLIFIDGEAGTGKTVLNSSTFYELYCMDEESNGKVFQKENDHLKCYLLVNHDQQILVYQQIIKKLGLERRYKEKNGDIVSKPTSFINNHLPEDPVDVAFIDEAHLLLTQGKQSYRGKNQLQDIIDRAKVTVVMFDENQILTTEQFWESEIINSFRNKAKEDENYIVLSKQLRMQTDELTLDWIDSFTKRQELKKLPKTSNGYEIKIFDDPGLLEKAIREKANSEESSLSRLIASYDWEYSQKNRPEDSQYWYVTINDWKMPWNYELEQSMNRKQKSEIKDLAWAEQPHTLNEVGSTFSIQGFDLNYAGIILGPSIKYRDGKIIFDPLCSANRKATQKRTLSDGSKKQFGETLIKHELRVLMTRGVNGMYIYACDEQLRNTLLEAAK